MLPPIRGGGITKQTEAYTRRSHAVTEWRGQWIALLKVVPLTGPLDGGTLVTIEGTNLGRSLDQVESAVTVAGVKCEVIPEKYIVSHQ